MDYRKLMALPPREERARYTARDTILYALGLGVGADDPLAEHTLRYVYEERLQALPTMAVVIAYPGFWLKEPQYGVDWKRVLHGEQSLELHRPLPIEADVVSRLRIEEIYDKGADKGALLLSSREIVDAGSGERYATLRSSAFLRGDGGCGGPREGAPKPHLVPARAPDLSVFNATREDQALIYRLSADYNPLHIDPDVARAAGFERPILHGLCSYGVIGRAALGALCAHDATRFRQLDVRFSAPVYPGETLRTDIWHQGPGRAALRARVQERDVVVVDNGLFVYEPA
nr:MaoC/PaaZ C-terminal domain-containing protein [Sinimarinibacterium flocculans]